MVNERAEELRARLDCTCVQANHPLPSLEKLGVNPFPNNKF